MKAGVRFGHFGTQDVAVKNILLFDWAGPKYSLKKLIEVAYEYEKCRYFGRHPNVLYVVDSYVFSDGIYRGEGGDIPTTKAAVVAVRAQGDGYQFIYTDSPSLNDSLGFIIQGVQGLKLIRSKGYFHGDFKPGNMLNIGGAGVVSDLGVTTPIGSRHEDLLGHVAGTYDPPEAVRYHNGETELLPVISDEKWDVYSLGATIAALIQGYFDPPLPSYTRETAGIYADLIRAHPDTILSGYESDRPLVMELRAIALDCLAPSRDDRPDLATAHQRLYDQHRH